MPRSRQSLVYVGIRNVVVAIDRKTGTEVWRAQLKGSITRSGSFVNVVRDQEGLFATCGGEVFGLDPRDGTILWNNPLKGLGTGLTTLVTDAGGSGNSITVPMIEESRRQAAAAAATAAAT